MRLIHIILWLINYCSRGKVSFLHAGGRGFQLTVPFLPSSLPYLSPFDLHTSLPMHVFFPAPAPLQTPTAHIAPSDKRCSKSIWRRRTVNIPFPLLCTFAFSLPRCFVRSLRELLGADPSSAHSLVLLPVFVPHLLL